MDAVRYCNNKGRVLFLDIRQSKRDLRDKVDITRYTFTT